jgi:hypothetical protein
MLRSGIITVLTLISLGHTTAAQDPVQLIPGVLLANETGLMGEEWP